MATILSNTGCQHFTSVLTGGTLGTHYLGWGTGAGTAAKADVILFTEASESRVALTRTASGLDTVQWVGTLTANGTKTITNVGNFTGSTSAAPGAMIVKGDFTGVALNANDMIQFTIYCQIT